MSFYGNIDPDNLIGLVKNTVPFIFLPENQKELSVSKIFETYPEKGWLYILNSFLLHPEAFNEQTKAIKWYEYFLLCISAHYASVMTFVPTDVDNKIRMTLWNDMEKRSVIEKMIEAVLQIQKWDMSEVSKRTFFDDEYGKLAGHDGEYLTILGGALGCCLFNEWKELAELVEKKIDEELNRENLIFKKYLHKNGREIDLLKVCAILTHNTGDLLRAIGMWNINLNLIIHYKKKYMGMMKKNDNGFRFFEAGLIYNEFLTHDNGRHLALRAPKIFRVANDFLLPIGPFFEEWGEMLGKNPIVKENDIIEIINALLDAAERTPLQKGYSRALAGLNRTLPKGLKEFEKKIQKQGLKTLKSLKIEEESKISPESFYQRLGKKLNTFIKDNKIT